MVPRIIGLSKAGWLAFSEPEAAGGPGLIELENLYCAEPDCHSDTPSFDGDLCYCPAPGGEERLTEMGIGPLPPLEGGTFPVEIAGVRYDISTASGTGPGLLIGSEAVLREVWLHAGEERRVLLGTIHDHLTSLVDQVCVAGWIRSPQVDPSLLAVLIGYAVAENSDQPDVVRFRIFGVDARRLTGEGSASGASE